MSVQEDQCSIYIKSENYRTCDKACQRTDDTYYECCIVSDYCSFYRSPWFFWIVFIVCVLLILVSFLGCAICCFRNRGNGNEDGEEDSEKDKDAESGESDDTI